MQVLAINGSARGKKGVTQRMLDAFCGGLINGGAEVDMLQVKGLDIASVPGLPALYAQDGRASASSATAWTPFMGNSRRRTRWFWAHRLYIDNMSAQLKTLLDRCTCAIRPDIEVDGLGRGASSHDLVYAQGFFTWSAPAAFPSR